MPIGSKLGTLVAILAMLSTSFMPLVALETDKGTSGPPLTSDAWSSPQTQDAAPRPASRDLGGLVTPEPQFIEDKGSTFILDSTWSIVLDVTDPAYKFIGDWFNLKVNTTNPLTLSVVGLNAMPADKRILVGDPAKHPQLTQALDRRNRTLPHGLGKEGYMLEAFDGSPKELIIWANAPNGAFYGMVTLLQLVKRDASVPGALVVDYPEHSIRGTYEPGSIALQWSGGKYNLVQKNKDFIDWLAMHKFNTVMPVENGVFFRAENQWLTAYSDLFNYSRARFIEPIPRLVSISTVSPFPPAYWEGWPIDNEKFTFNASDGAVADIPSSELATNGDFEVDANLDNIPDGWTVNNKNGATWTIDKTLASSGAWSMRLDVPAPTINSSSATLARTFNGVVPNSYYCIWAKARAQNIVSVEPQLTIYVRNAGGQVRVLQSDVTWSTAGWIDFGICLRTPSDANNIVVYSRIQNPGTGTFWLDDIHLIRVNGGLRNIIRSNPDMDINVTDLSGLTRYKEGTDYKVVNGTIQMKFAWNLKPFEVIRLPGGAIAAGQSVLISYDPYLFSSISSYWSSAPCVAKEELYTKYLFPAIDKILARLNATTINIDLDEVRGFYRDRRMLAKYTSPGDAFANYSNRIDDYLTAKCPGCRLWIWDDMVSPYHNGGDGNYQVAYGGQPGRGADATEKDWMTKNVIQDIWWYGDNWITQMYQTVKYFNTKGYDVMGSPWLDEQNTISWSEILLDQPNSLGGIETNWGTPWQDAHIAFADNFWNTRYKIVLFDSFEDDLDHDNRPNGWISYSPINYSTDSSKDFGTRLNGYPNCSVAVRGSAWNDLVGTETPLEIRPNTKYNLSAYIMRGDPASTGNPTMLITWTDKSKQIWSQSQFTVNDVGPAYKRFDFNVTSPNWAQYATVIFGGSPSDTETFWFDVIRFKEETKWFGIIGPRTLPDGVENWTYQDKVTAAGGVAPYSFNISNGSLPKGLEINPAGWVHGAPMESGTFNFTVKATDAALRTDQQNYSINISLRDLAVGNISSPDEIWQGDHMKINATVRKLGNWTVGAHVEVQLFSHGIEQNFTYIDVDTDPVINVTFVWRGTMWTGPDELSFVIGTINGKKESYYDNNIAKKIVHVRLLPDLEVSYVTVEPIPAYEKEFVAFYTLVESHWDRVMVANVSLYIDDVRVESKNVSLAANGSIETGLYWLNTTVGTHKYNIMANMTLDIRDTNIYNNGWHGSFQVYRRPDLNVTSVKVPPGTLLEGETVEVMATIGIDHELPMNDTFTLEFGYDDIILGNRTITIFNDTEKIFYFNWTAVRGTHALFVRVDTNNKIKERDENNNKRSLNVTAYRLPDLRFGGIQFSNDTPWTGDKINMTVNVTAELDQAVLTVFYVQVQVDGAIIYHEIMSVRHTATLNVTCNWTVTNGTHSVNVTIDPEKQVKEFNEANNFGSKTIVGKWKEVVTPPKKKPKPKESYVMYYSLIAAIVTGTVIAVLLLWFYKTRRKGADKQAAPKEQPAERGPGH